MSKKQAFLKYVLSINLTISILAIIALINVDRNTAQFFVLIFTMLMNIILGIAVITKIYTESGKQRKQK